MSFARRTTEIGGIECVSAYFQEIQVEAGPQDGTLLVTWQPVSRPPQSGPVTGYAVYADGKKVTDVDSPTGDHALIDISKLVGLNPRAVTVRTKSRDAQSSDSAPTIIPSKFYYSWPIGYVN